MVKDTRTYIDFDGNERTETFHFNLTEAEIQEFNLTTPGGLKQMLDEIIASKDLPRIVMLFKDIVLMSYGVKSADGRFFKKSDEIREEFKATQAYSDIFMELATDTEKASAFVNGIIPKTK